MGYFPFFMDMEGKEGLIIGGGSVARRKMEKLLPYGSRLTIAAPRFQEQIRQTEGIVLVQGPFTEELLEGKYFVIAATDDEQLNRRIAKLCGERGILVNVADRKELCTFLFPSLVKRGRLSVGISTEGASPSAAIRVKEKLEQWIPENFDRILEFLESKRPVVKAAIPSEEDRARVFARLFGQCMEKGRPLTEEEFQQEIRLTGYPECFWPR